MKELNIQPEQKEEKRIKKNKDRLRSLWDIFKRTNIQIKGVPEGEEEEQEVENLFEKLMEESFLNLAKEIDIQVQEAQRVRNKLDPERTTPRHIIIKVPKVNDKKKTLKTASKKKLITYKGAPIRFVS